MVDPLGAYQIFVIDSLPFARGRDEKEGPAGVYKPRLALLASDQPLHEARMPLSSSVIQSGCALAAVVAIAPPCWAQSVDLQKLLHTDVSLERQVTTATRVATKATLAPATVDVITAEDIQNRGYMNLEEVLHDLPGFSFDRGYGEEWSTIFMRGFRTNNSDHFLLMIDGIVENDLWKSNAWIANQYPLSNIERIEVTYGPASALYGPNASGGIINLITKTGEQQSGGTVQLGGGSLGTAYTDTTWGTLANGIDLSITGRYFHQDGRTDVAGRFPGFLYNNPNPAYQAGLNPAFDNHKNDGGLWAKVGLPGLTLGASSWSRADAQGYWYNDSQRVPSNGSNWDPAFTTLYSRYQARVAGNGQFSSLLSYRYTKLNGTSEIYQFLPTTQQWNTSYWSELSKELDFNNQLQLQPLDNLSLTTGFELANGNFQGNYNTGPTPFPEETGGPEQPAAKTGAGNDYDVTRGGVYGQGVYTPWDPLQITIGGRYDYRVFRNTPAYGGVGGVFSPRLGAVYSPTDRWTFKALYASGFIDPDNYTIFSTGSGRKVPAIGLRPERLHSFEGSVGYSFTETLHNELAVYHNDYWDTFGVASVQDPDFPNDPTRKTTQNQNLGDKHVVGAEYRLRWAILPGLKAYLNATYDNSLNDQGQNLGDIPALSANVGLDGHEGNWRWSFRNNLVGDRYTVPSNPAGHLPGYVVTNLSLGYSHLFLRALRADFVVDNLFDVQYSDPGVRSGTGVYASLLPQNGRAFLGRLTYGF